jgi:hypothetical protein
MPDSSNAHTVGPSVTSDEVLSHLVELAEGRLTRAAAAAWARRRNHPSQLRGPPGSRFDSDDVRGAFYALCAADLSEVTFKPGRSPYFIRDEDIATWTATIRKLDPPRQSTSHVVPKRPHQCRPIGATEAVLSIPAGIASERLKVPEFRSCDDLDYYRAILFDTAGGLQVLLQWRPRHHPDEAHVFLEAAEARPDTVLQQLLDILWLSGDAMIWRRGVSAQAASSNPATERMRPQSHDSFMPDARSTTGGATPTRMKSYWAYDFECDQPLERMLTIFTAAGPWRWELRESAWYGDYLNTQPRSGVRVRINEYPQAGEAGTFVGLREKGFSALLQIRAESSATQTEVDETFRRLLATTGATKVKEIEPYD